MIQESAPKKKKKKKKNKTSLKNVLFNGHQSFFFQGFCDEVKSGTYPLKPCSSKKWQVSH
jgi:hypothetical protein